jgi:NADH:ubiquinone oxidoreductase subunit C
VAYDSVPGLVEAQEAYGETTLVVEPERLVEAATHLRDELGFRLLSDITPTDYLGWATEAELEAHIAKLQRLDRSIQERGP